MDPRYEQVAKSYQAHSNSISPKDKLNYGVSGIPDPELTLDGQLIQSRSGAETAECANSKARGNMWLATPHPYRAGYNFSLLLGRICIAAKLHECRREKCLEAKAAMQTAASACNWEGLPDFLVGAATREAFREAESMAICRNRSWNMLDVSDRKQADLPCIVNALRSYP